MDLLRLLLLCVAFLAFQTSPVVPQDARQVIDLYPDRPRHSERVPYGVTQIYRVSDLDPNGVYDVKVSYPATLPSTFTLQLERVLLPLPVANSANNNAILPKSVHGVLPPRRHLLNTAKLRLRVSELQSHQSVRYRLKPSGDAVQVEFSLLAEIEGVKRPDLDKSEVCVFDIVVEKMLLEAFPRDTLVLIGWLVMLLGMTFKWVLPYLERKIALRCVEDQGVEKDS